MMDNIVHLLKHVGTAGEGVPAPLHFTSRFYQYTLEEFVPTVTRRRTKNVTLPGALRVSVALVVIVGGFGVALWEHGNARACQQQYGDDPSVAVDCQDALYLVLV